jgi:pyrroline-5-carboxylate reductase
MHMKIALIGAGNMGEAILAGTHRRHKFLVAEPRKERQTVLRRRRYRCVFGDLDIVASKADVILLAVKPQDFPDVLAELSRVPMKGKLIISIAAGITTRYIEWALKQPVRVVRVMPNLPALIGEGMSALAKGARATPRDLALAKGIFEAVGATLTVKEQMLDAVTAVSGSGPAYVFLFVESLMKAARKLGFSEQDAKELVYRTLLGSALLLDQSAESAGELRLKVTSKGGTTQAATDVFLKSGIFRVYDEALKAAKARARQLSK